MNQHEGETWEDDGEYAAHCEEMRQEAPRVQAMLIKRDLETGKPYWVETDHHSMLYLVRAHNDMAAVLREFVARHPEDADLAHRVKRFL